MLNTEVLVECDCGIGFVVTNMGERAWEFGRENCIGRLHLPSGLTYLPTGVGGLPGKVIFCLNQEEAFELEKEIQVERELQANKENICPFLRANTYREWWRPV